MDLTNTLVQINEKYILDKIGQGYILGVNKNIRSDNLLFPRFGKYGERIIYLHNRELVERVIRKLYKLSELGEPPFGEREGVTSYRQGWREIGLSDKYDWYVHIQ